MLLRTVLFSIASLSGLFMKNFLTNWLRKTTIGSCAILDWVTVCIVEMGLFPHTNLGTDKCLNMQRWCTFNVLLVVRISHIHILSSWSLNPEGHFCGNYSSHWKTWFVQFMFDIIWAIDALTVFSGLVTTLNMRWIKLRNFKVDVGWNHQMLQGLR